MFITGEIRAFAFNANLHWAEVVNQGWIPCDGRALSIFGHQELYNALGIDWGSPNPTESFCVPNFFGSFLRGATLWDNTPYDPKGSHDPEAGSRIHPREDLTAKGATGKRVGSFQEDEVGKHKHKYYGKHSSVKGWTEAIFTQGETKGPYTGAILDYEGKETRPCNHYVMYMIFGGTVPKETKNQIISEYKTDK